MKVLNLYACLGGNRLLWEDCEVTAIELDPELARMYWERFPEDTVIVTDAHQYLLDNYQEFDFIWSSPPCPSHSRARFWNTKADRQYPDMRLYQEILLLQTHFKGKWIVENVVPYYNPLIRARKIGRHLFWSNFIIPVFETNEANCRDETIKELERLHKIDASSYKGDQRKDKILRNMVHYDTGLHIFNLARGIIIDNNKEQSSIIFPDA